jgi:1,4-dihydroxy-2-naphthoate octaprenyltransferase
VALLAVCAAVGLVLMLQVGQALVPFVAAGLLLIVGYTPYMTRMGIGEVAAGLGLGLLPVLGAAVVQGGHVGAGAVAAGVPAFFMTFNLLFLNEFPDEAADRAGGRRNLVLLLGRLRAARLYLAAAALGVASIPAAVALGLLPVWSLAAVLPAVALVPAVRWALGAPAAPVPLAALGGNVVWNLATNALLAAGFAVVAATR